jgi:hypothetical protein
MRCPACDSQNFDSAVRCTTCGAKMKVPFVPVPLAITQPIVPPSPSIDPLAEQNPVWRVNTNLGVICPYCQSKNVAPRDKPGLGCFFFATLPIFVILTIFDAILRVQQPQPYACNFCQNTFQVTPAVDQSAKHWASDQPTPIPPAIKWGMIFVCLCILGLLVAVWTGPRTDTQDPPTASEELPSGVAPGWKEVPM